MHTLSLISFYVCATNDVSTFHVPYLLPLSVFRGCPRKLRGSQEEAEQIPQMLNELSMIIMIMGKDRLLLVYTAD